MEYEEENENRKKWGCLIIYQMGRKQDPRSSEFERKEVEIVRVASKNLHEMI